MCYLLSETRETLVSETARVHIAAWRRGRLAARGARAAGGDAGDQVSTQRVAPTALHFM
jgi:hypothetical protein